ncbi:MAG: hypothetical protein V1865_01020 [bacterium]
MPKIKAYKTMVDYDQTLVKVNSYDWVDNNIVVKNFPVEKSGKVDLNLALIHSNFLWTGQMKRWMEYNDLRPANIAELLAFGEAYPDEQQKYSIVALGSIWLNEEDEQHYVPFIQDISKSYLGLHRFGSNWYGNWRFLVASDKDIKVENLRVMPEPIEFSEFNYYQVSIDYDESLEEMIEDGDYSYVSDKHYINTCDKPNSGESKVNLQKIYFREGWYSNSNIKKWMGYNDLRPANIAELLAFGEAYPDEQREDNIIAIGSSCGYANAHTCPALIMKRIWKDEWLNGRRLSEMERGLYLDGFIIRYSDKINPNYNPDNYCYLAVCSKVVEDENLKSEIKEWPVRINYDQSLEEMIAAGNYKTREKDGIDYDWTMDDINSKNFSINGKGLVDVNLITVNFNRLMYLTEVFLEFEKLNLRPANIEELLAFGEQYPEEQRKYSIVTLSSALKNRLPYLSEYAGKRKLATASLSYGLNENWHFLAVYK